MTNRKQPSNDDWRQFRETLSRPDPTPQLPANSPTPRGSRQMTASKVILIVGGMIAVLAYMGHSPPNPSLAADGNSAAGGAVVLVVVALALALAAYFLPSIVAAARKHRNTTAIFFLNLLLGWSVIGWVGALVWALANRYSATVIVNPTPQQPLPAPRENRRPCPFCAEPIVSAAKICRFCGKELLTGWAEAAAQEAYLATFERWGSRPNRNSR